MSFMNPVGQYAIHPSCRVSDVSQRVDDEEAVVGTAQQQYWILEERFRKTILQMAGSS